MSNKSAPKYRTLLTYLSGVKRFLGFSIFATALSIMFNFLAPQVVRFTVDTVIGSEAVNPMLEGLLDMLGGREHLRSNIIFCALGVTICALFSAVFNYMSRTNIAKCAEGYVEVLRNRLFDHIQRLPFKWHVDNQTGDIIQRCTYDVDMLRAFISGQFLEVLRTFILIVVALIFMFSMNTTLALIGFAFIPLIILYSMIFYSKISKEFLGADEAEGDLMVNIQENLTGVRVVKAFGRQGYELGKFDKSVGKFVSSWVNLGYTLGTYWGVGDFATGVQIMTVIAAGAYMAASGNISLGEFLVFVSYTQTLSWPVRALGRTLSEMSKSVVSAERLAEILETEPEKDLEEAFEPDLHQEIVFKDVSFSYGDYDKATLDNLNFTIEKGSTFGILGGTGSGKSTITYLLTRLYDLEDGQGSIRIGGVDLKRIGLHYLRRNVGLVLQEPFLFSKSIKANIDIAAGKDDIAQIRRRARVADVDENIMGFTNGYDTVVGERGVTLSGGQKQRIAIARTLMLDAPIMIFDDSLSAVDMETDARIVRSLRENAGGATVILISHRVSTLMNADKILVLENGKQAEIGSHHELISRDGIYNRVYRLQSDDGEGKE